MENRNNDLLAQIEAALPELSKGQRLIARYIVENYDKAAYMTASALGSEVGVSESTVVRFANEMGYDGYPQLQRQIRETVRVKLTSVQRVASVNDRIPEDEILGYSLAADMNNIKSTIEKIDREQFTRAVDMILGA
ncbi:MAG: MurR/RpiR family transcriptional regulator, partial [Clostridia bacterium]|nr:MurR/RpiR family transcriptional regulator [Clostridia bacterium]